MRARARVRRAHAFLKEAAASAFGEAAAAAIIPGIALSFQRFCCGVLIRFHGVVVALINIIIIFIRIMERHFGREGQ